MIAVRDASPITNLAADLLLIDEHLGRAAATRLGLRIIVMGFANSRSMKQSSSERQVEQ